MIKGVNKKVIEINQPDSAYFERAVLYLRPDVTEVSLHEAQAETEGYFAYSTFRRSGRGIRSWMLFLLGMATSAAVCLVIFWLLG